MSGARRPILVSQAPNRQAGGFYRAASEAAEHTGGVPLNSANAAMLAAVRLAYDVAETQIDRSNRLARRLREAGDSVAGPNSDRQALDGAERLVTKAILSGLEWWETSVAEGRCPTTRLIGAEYRLFGKILGFDQPTPPVPSQPVSNSPKPRQPAGRSDPPRWTLAITHVSAPEHRRPVTTWSVAMSAVGEPTETLHFFNSEGSSPSRTANIAPDGPATLRLKIATKDWPPGHWRAAICDDGAVQLGVVEIAL